MVSVPLRTQTASSPVPTTLSVSAVAKPQTVSPGSPANNPASPAVLQGVTSPNIKQVTQFVSASYFDPSGKGLFLACMNIFLVKKLVIGRTKVGGGTNALKLKDGIYR